MAKIVTITNPLTGQPAQVDQLDHTAQQIDDAITRALPGGAIDITLQKKVDGLESTDYPGCYYRTVDGVVEWLNPPMALGVEYRTTERYLGKPVYVKTVQAFESLTGSDAVDLCEVPVDNADKCISCTGETSTNWSLPSDVIGGGSSHIYIGAQVDVNVIKIWAKTDRSSWSQAIRVTIKYTKTTE